MDGDTGHVLDRLEEKLADVLFVLPDRPAKDQLIVAGRGGKGEETCRRPQVSPSEAAHHQSQPSSPAWPGTQHRLWSVQKIT